MELFKIKSQQDIEQLSIFATAIIKEYYDPLLGQEQNDYMIKMFQSVEGITNQINQGYKYYFICKNSLKVGYLAVFSSLDHLYISKFYLLKEERNKGIGREVLAELISRCKQESLRYISLNVNKYNPSIKAYEKLGFYRYKDEVNDIGHGYVMDDYVYRLDIS